MQNVSTLLDLIFKDKENSIKFWSSLSNILQKDNNEIQYHYLIQSLE
jgi:hypothetical protein